MSVTAQATWDQVLQTALICGVTVVALGVLVATAWKLRACYRDGADDAADGDEMLLQFKELHRQGGLTDDEYRSIRGRLASQLADSSAVGMDSKNQARTLHNESSAT